MSTADEIRELEEQVRDMEIRCSDRNTVKFLLLAADAISMAKTNENNKTLKERDKS